jgi:hypothetical protein
MVVVPQCQFQRSSRSVAFPRFPVSENPVSQDLANGKRGYEPDLVKQVQVRSGVLGFSFSRSLRFLGRVCLKSGRNDSDEDEVPRQQDGNQEDHDSQEETESP